MSISYLNGCWQPVESARVPVLDRGFMFGDGVYEVMPVYEGHILACDRHLARLDRSLRELRIDSPMDIGEWMSLLAEAVERSEIIGDAVLYVQVTRGVAKLRSHVYPDSAPTVLVTVTDFPLVDRTPLRVCTERDFRWQRGDIKVTSLVANGLLKNEALANGYQDAILLREGALTEATASNVFVVIDGEVVTPPLSDHLLHGITREIVLELARANEFPVSEREISAAELLNADEVWLTSTTNELCPVGSINGQTIGNGEAGTMFMSLNTLFQEAKING